MTKNGQKCHKTATKMQKIGQKSQKNDQKSHLKYAPIAFPCSMPPRGLSKSNTIRIKKRDHSGSVP